MRPKKDILACLAMHVGNARRWELALDRKLDTGRFGAVSAKDPWPGHDAALCRETATLAERSWLHAVEQLLDLFAVIEPDEEREDLRRFENAVERAVAETARRASAEETWNRPAFSPEENRRRRFDLLFPLPRGES